MTTGQFNEPTAANASSPPSRPSSSGRRWPLVVSLSACLVLGILSLRANSQAAALRSRLSDALLDLNQCRKDVAACRDERDSVTTQRRQLQIAALEADEELDRLRTRVAELEADLRRLKSQVEIAEAETERTRTERDAARSSLAIVRTSLDQCQDRLEDTLGIAGDLRSKLDEVAAAIRKGLIFVRDIPAKDVLIGLGLSLGPDGDYNKLVREYNDLAERFNAAVDRSNDLGDIVNKVIRILNR
jgi:hypothetical protein